MRPMTCDAPGTHLWESTRGARDLLCFEDVAAFEYIVNLSDCPSPNHLWVWYASGGLRADFQADREDEDVQSKSWKVREHAYLCHISLGLFPFPPSFCLFLLLHFFYLDIQFFPSHFCRRPIKMSFIFFPRKQKGTSLEYTRPQGKACSSAAGAIPS